MPTIAKCTFVLIVALITISPSVFGTPTRNTSFAQLEETYPWSGTRHLSEAVRNASIQAGVEEALRGVRKQFQMGSHSGFSVGQRLELRNQVCIRHTQTLHRREILGTQLNVCFHANGEVQSKVASLCDAECLKRAISTKRLTTHVDSHAENMLREYLGDRVGRVVESSVDSIWIESPGEKGLRDAHRVRIITEHPYARFVAYVDDETGSFVEIDDEIFFEKGTGFVYEQDPVNTPEPEIVDLEGLYVLDRLMSEYWVIQNEDTHPIAASDPEGYYVYELADTRFSEVQAYYGMQKGMGRLMAWGFLPPEEPLPIVVHYGTNYANAFYDRTKIALGDGDNVNLRNLSLDNSVVIHENGHYVVDEVAKIRFSQWAGDGGAIHEGHADYFACATYDYPALGEGVIPDGTPLRRCDTVMDYSEKDGEVHYAGQVWSGALWEIRETLGTLGDENVWWQTTSGDSERVTDFLALYALMYVKHTGAGGTTQMMDMVRAIYAADEALFEGRHLDTIKTIFGNRGFPVEGDVGPLAMK